MIDIHTHVIPGVDDGAKTVVDSQKMLELYREAGFRSVIATPHLSLTSEPTYTSKLEQGFRETVSQAKSMGITLINGREIRLSPEIQQSAPLLATAGLGGTKYVLVDFPSGSWPHYAEDSIFRLQMMGFVPILAHPERYGWGVHHRYTPRDLVERGVLIQVTLGSFVGTFGSNPRNIAKELLDDGLVHFTATDAHGAGTRMRAAIKGIEWLRKEYGKGAIEDTLEVSPSELLLGEEIRPFVPTRNRRQWIGFDFRKLFSRGS